MAASISLVDLSYLSDDNESAEECQDAAVDKTAEPQEPVGELFVNVKKEISDESVAETVSNEEESDEGEIVLQKGDLINEYRIERVLGRGIFADVVAVTNTNEDDKLVALKIVEDNANYVEASKKEIAALKKLRDTDEQKAEFIVHFYGEFVYKKHQCIVLSVMGPSIAEFMSRNGNRPFPLEQVGKMASDLLRGVEYLHSIGIIHTDLKADDILLREEEYQEVETQGQEPYHLLYNPSVVICDLNKIEPAHSREDKKEKREYKTHLVQSCSYRAPEVIFGLPWDAPIDLWSVGCLIFEMFTGRKLFEEDGRRGDVTPNFNDQENELALCHLAKISQHFGKFPLEYFGRSPYFSKKDYYVVDEKMKLLLESEADEKEKKLRVQFPNNWTTFGPLMGRLLEIRPCARATAAEALELDFLVEK